MSSAEASTEEPVDNVIVANITENEAPAAPGIDLLR